MSDSVPAPDSERYTHGHHASVVGQHARRTAEREAAYLLPHLQPGMRLLDIGCGPGTITTGLARAVAPAAVTGIDLVPEVVETARQHLAETGLANVRFEAASVYDLPYEDASFEAAHAHQVLQHLAHPVAAAREAHRVLTPGGILGVRDADYATMQAWPRPPEIDRWLEVYHAVATRNGADADAGRRLPSWLSEAGFVDLEVSGSVVVFHEPGDVRNWGYSWSERIVQSALAEQAVEYDIATPADLQAIAAGWRRWADSPDALFMYVNIEVIGRKAG
ncbi:MAG: methyltransferase domain-containing protein [Dehalococcoidia bacterium]|nr:methyltransferase domain-containing protein [Dehalococcoidia bacterium]